MSFNPQNGSYGLSYKAQSELQTANVATDFWKVSRVQGGFNKFSPVNESDAAEYGKGSEFAENEFPVSMDTGGSIEKILSSELAAWAFLFGIGTGKATYVAGAYTIHETDACDGLDMPAFSAVEQGGVGCQAGAFYDRMAIGCVINDFGVKFQNGPGRSSAMLSVNFVGSGATAEPSGIVLPDSKLVEHEMRGGSATVSINGVDYGASKDLMTLDMNFQNNIKLDQGFFIGSGLDSSGYAIRGRLERGNRLYTLSFTTRLQVGSTEHTKLKAQTAGTAVVTLSNSSTESLSVTFHKVTFKTADLAEDNGIVTVAVQCEIMRDPINGVLTVVAKTAVIGIAGVI